MPLPVCIALLTDKLLHKQKYFFLDLFDSKYMAIKKVSGHNSVNQQQFHTVYTAALVEPQMFSV